MGLYEIDYRAPLATFEQFKVRRSLNSFYFIESDASASPPPRCLEQCPAKTETGIFRQHERSQMLREEREKARERKRERGNLFMMPAMRLC